MKFIYRSQDRLIALDSNSKTTCGHDLMCNLDCDKIIRLLVNRTDEKFWSKSDTGGFTAVHHASMCGNVEGLKTLLNSFSLSLNCQTDEGLTPLHLAYKEGKTDMVKFLLSKEAVNSDVTDKYGRKPVDLCRNKR